MNTTINGHAKLKDADTCFPENSGETECLEEPKATELPPKMEWTRQEQGRVNRLLNDLRKLDYCIMGLTKHLDKRRDEILAKHGLGAGAIVQRDPDVQGTLRWIARIVKSKLRLQAKLKELGISNTTDLKMFMLTTQEGKERGRR